MLLTVAMTVGLGLPANANRITDSGQHAFQRGAFDEAAAGWQKELEKHRRDGNTKAEIAAMVSLATAYQSLGHLQRAESPAVCKKVSLWHCYNLATPGG